jgi:fission process protein 1
MANEGSVANEQGSVVNKGELVDIESGKGPDSTDTPLRYAAYGARIRTALSASSRLVAYTSDVGESLRPVAHPYLVKGGYAVSIAYVVGDVAYETNRQRTNPRPGMEGRDWRRVAVERAAFQGIASMVLPAFTIHSVVKYSGQAIKNLPNKTLRLWGPVALGLGTVPALPFLFDKPVEHVVDAVGERIAEIWERS